MIDKFQHVSRSAIFCFTLIEIMRPSNMPNSTSSYNDNLNCMGYHLNGISMSIDSSHVVGLHKIASVKRKKQLIEAIWKKILSHLRCNRYLQVILSYAASTI